MGLCSAVAGQAPDPSRRAVDPSRIRLVTLQAGYGLLDARDVRREPAAVPREWLIPPDEEKESAELYVAGFNYSERTNAFDLGDGRLGVHASSYETMTEGSAAYAGGRDKFLIYDPRTRHAAVGGLAPGITKERIRMSDCLWWARHTRFFVRDVNGDGLADLGLQVESPRCPARPADEEFRNVEEELDDVRRFHAEPLRWHVLRGERWEHDPNLDGTTSGGATELPLIDLEMTPIEFARKMLQTVRRHMKRPPPKP